MTSPDSIKHTIPEDVEREARKAFDDAGLTSLLNKYSYDHVRTCIAKAILAERQRSQWQPIETAPRDRKLLVGHFRKPSDASEWNGIIQVDRWNEKYKSGFGRFNEYYWPATHWMPLPPAPTGEA